MDYKRNFLERLYINFAVWLTFLKKEKQVGGKKISFKKINSLRKGFLSERPIPYDFKKWRHEDYISDKEIIKLTYLNYPYSKILRNKFVFGNFFKNYFNTPESYCIINKNIVEPLNKHLIINTVSQLLELLKSCKKLILKPLLGARGKGIFLIESTLNGNFRVNKKEKNLNEIEEFLKTLNEYFVSEFIEQGNFSKQFFPDSTNTIRITTFFNPLTRSAITPYALMRFGRPKTIPADNAAIGGIYALIDLETGMLDGGVEVLGKGNIVNHSVHPDTEVQIKGVIIPNWKSLMNIFNETAVVISPFLKIVGWDIVLTEDTFYVIEGNNGPDLIIQGHEHPLAKDEDVSQFLKHSKIR